MAKISLGDKKMPTYGEVIEEILRPLQSPMLIEDLAEMVLKARPSQAKNPRQAVLNKIREEDGRTLLLLDDQYLLPLELAWRGVRFRVPLAREVVDKGWLDIEQIVRDYLPWGFKMDHLLLVDAAEEPIEYRSKTVNRIEHSILGDTQVSEWQIDLGAWLRGKKVFHKDHLLFTILDRKSGIFSLDFEPAKALRYDLIKEQDQRLVSCLFEMLEASRDESLSAYRAVPKAYRSAGSGGYPGNHWVTALEVDKRMRFDGWIIYYLDSRISMLDEMLFGLTGKAKPATVIQKLDRKQTEQVYRFKAELKDKPRIWRMIEIQGKQSLYKFDRALRSAFQHDTSDHLGGFWKLVLRGAVKQKAHYREVDLGHVDPLGGGDAAKVKVAEIKMEVGDRLKYVYDFGDWIEHLLTLESIDPPQSAIKYPREISRNKPRYEYCQICKTKDIQSVAKWICITCSNEQHEAILLCEGCYKKHDEEHYLDELIY